MFLAVLELLQIAAVQGASAPSAGGGPSASAGDVPPPLINADAAVNFQGGVGAFFQTGSNEVTQIMNTGGGPSASAGDVPPPLINADATVNYQGGVGGFFQKGDNEVIQIMK
uniref:Uncharacterized protein n=1 Tax=Rhodnius prolixus TaxID=13249 RepID=T1IA89_RHOPR